MRANPFDTDARHAAARLIAAAAVLATVCALFLVLDGRPASAQSIADREAALGDVRDRQDALAEQIAADNSQINALIGQVSEARQREQAAAEELARAEEQLDAAEAELEQGREHLARVRDQLHEAIGELRRIVVGVYKSGDPEAMRLIIESAKWQDADIDAAYLDRVEDYQSNAVGRVRDLRDEAEATVERLADAKQRIEEQRDAIAQRRQELADVRASLEAQEQQLAAARASRRDTLASLQSRESDLEAGIQRAQERAERQASAPPPLPTTSSDPSVAAPAPAAAPPAGSKATINADGTATPPADAPPEVVAVIEAANEIEDAPYVWGGGHGSFESSGYDCSGAVSYALNGGGFLSSPLDSTGLGYWGEAGEGNWITVYANSGHVFMWVAGLRWDTSDTGGSGPSWSYDASSWETSQSWAVRHPAGF